MGPPPEYPCSFSRQAPPRCRQRLCLLKGCERPFQPRHPLARYCSPECREAARRWSLWRANQRYRASDQGRCQRREQSSRRRARAVQRHAEESAGQDPREGYHKTATGEEFCCSRPGCYQCFTRSSRSPLQSFCCFSCRRALRRVLQRESRWLQHGIGPRDPVGGRGIWPDP